MERQKKSFLIAIGTLFVLMSFTYVLTLTMECKGLNLLSFIASPILVLGSSSGSTIIAIIIFLIIIGGIVEGLNRCGFLEYMIGKIVYLYGKKRYKLMAILVFFFMAMGSLIGSFEEVVPLVPIVTGLAVELGFDALTGVGMSLLAVGCGFAAGVANPFTIGVAQGLANLPMFSGALFRTVGFVLIYLLLMAFLYTHAKRVAKDIEGIKREFVRNELLDRSLMLFAIIMGIGLIIVLASPFLTFLQDYTMIIIALMFLIAGTVAILSSNTSFKSFGKYFIVGVLNIAPSILLILMASSIRYIREESGLITVILDKLINVAENMNRIELVLFMYFVCLIMEFFVSSGSAKAFLLMPILIPLCVAFDINPQLCILAYAFGDGFSNVFYPTNPALLISLGLINMDYGTWFRYSWKFQLLNFILTSGILIVGLYVTIL